MTTTAPVLLDIRRLSTAINDANRPTPLVHEVSLQIHSGETLAVVGESGSGKTLTFLSALGIAPPSVKVTAGEVLFEGDDLLKLAPSALRARRGTGISMVFQDPLSALNPVFSIGTQIVEVLRAHLPITQTQARARAIELLERVHIPDPHRRVDDYPHQFSGGMRQRALIAMAIALGPKVLIADEPTTALDVTVQAQVLELLTQLRDETGMALVLITHDLGLVARHADRVAVFYAGRVVEQAAVRPLFHTPRHPYTVSLFRTIPHLDSPLDAMLTPIDGQPPVLAKLPTGCPFAPRCYMAKTDCVSTHTALMAAPTADHLSACHHWPAIERET